jgi:hypothetical protein
VYVVAAAGGVGAAVGEGVADGVATADMAGFTVVATVGVEGAAEADSEDAGNPSADGDCPTDVVVQAPSASAATIRRPGRPERRPLVRVIAEV